MSDLFEENEEEIMEVGSEFEEIAVDEDLDEFLEEGLDARKRLENMLEERRLRNELDDFVDY